MDLMKYLTAGLIYQTGYRRIYLEILRRRTILEGQYRTRGLSRINMFNQIPTSPLTFDKLITRFLRALYPGRGSMLESTETAIERNPGAVRRQDYMLQRFLRPDLHQTCCLYWIRSLSSERGGHAPPWVGHQSVTGHHTHTFTPSAFRPHGPHCPHLISYDLPF